MSRVLSMCSQSVYSTSTCHTCHQHLSDWRQSSMACCVAGAPPLPAPELCMPGMQIALQAAGTGAHIVPVVVETRRHVRVPPVVGVVAVFGLACQLPQRRRGGEEILLCCLDILVQKTTLVCTLRGSDARALYGLMCVLCSPSLRRKEQVTHQGRMQKRQRCPYPGMSDAQTQMMLTSCPTHQSPYTRQPSRTQQPCANVCMSLEGAPVWWHQRSHQCSWQLRGCLRTSPPCPWPRTVLLHTHTLPLP